MTTTVEAPVEPQAAEVAEAEEPTRITQVEDLPDPVRADIIARRQAGETLAELKTRFGHVDPAVIREVLPPANASERSSARPRPRRPRPSRASAAAAARSSPSRSHPRPEAPKPEPKPRYSTDTDLVTSLAERTIAARQVMGRNVLAEALDTTGSAVWRYEHGRIHPDEVEPLYEAIAKVEDRIAAGEFVKAEKAPAVKSPSAAFLKFGM